MAKTPKLKLMQCRTVEELIAELQKLPLTMPVELFDDGVVLVPVNVGKHDEHLNIEGMEATCWREGRDWEPRD